MQGSGRANGSPFTPPAAVKRDSDPFLVAEIDDDGPGLDKNARAAAVERGKHLDKSRPGSGLGLSIVVELASIYGGSLQLDESPLGGLRAILAVAMRVSRAPRDSAYGEP